MKKIELSILIKTLKSLNKSIDCDIILVKSIRLFEGFTSKEKQE